MSNETTKTEIVLADIRPDSLSRREEWIKQRDDLAQRAAVIAIVTSDSELETAGRLQTEITRLLKDLEAARMALTRPLDNLKKQLTAQEKELAATLEAELFRLKKLNSEYATKKAAEAEAAQKRAEAERLAQAEREMAAQQSQAQKAASLFGAGAVFTGAPAPAAAAVPVQPAEPIPQGPRTSSNAFVETWQFQITDSSQVPRQFMTIDETKIRAWLKSQKALGYDIQALCVPGLHFYKETQVRSK